MDGPFLRRVGPARRTDGTNVVFLHGGRPQDTRPTTPVDLPYLRMVSLALAISAKPGRSQIYLLRNRVRGWNDADPVHDARWGIDELTRDDPGARVIFVGHSMGARAALLAATSEPRVDGVIALAAWVDRGDLPVLRQVRCPVFAAHGTADRITAPGGSEVVVRAINDAGGRARYRDVPGENHSLTRRPGLWPKVIRDGLSFVGAREP